MPCLQPYDSYLKSIITKEEELGIKKAAKQVSPFFSIAPTTSQAQLKDKIDELDLLEKQNSRKPV